MKAIISAPAKQAAFINKSPGILFNWNVIKKKLKDENNHTKQEHIRFILNYLSAQSSLRSAFLL
jgi:hypothetical protein